MDGPSVVIAGDGVAASALACLLRDGGFEVVLLTRRRRVGGAVAVPVVEALPEATVRLLAEVGLAGALAAAGAVTVRGFDNAYGPGARILDGVWTHVDRGRLARECLLVARRRGAVTLPVGVTGPAATLPGGGVEVRAGEAHLRAFAMVDATGRTARWSRPVARDGSDVATVYTGPGRTVARPGRVVRLRDGWAYRLEHPLATTVGVVARGGTGVAALDGVAAGELGVDDPECFVRVGARSAAVQWSCEPVRPGRLAVGDAALALSPLAGQGVRFAVSSALATAAVLRTWTDGAALLAADYYRSFVDGVRTRHLTKLAATPAESTIPAWRVDHFDTASRPIRHGESTDPAHSAAVDDPTGVRLDPGRRLRWTARVERVGVNRGGRIVADEAAVLPDGGLVRWVGGVDLLLVRDALAEGRTAREVGIELARLGVADRSAQALLAWALRVGAVG